LRRIFRSEKEPFCNFYRADRENGDSQKKEIKEGRRWDEFKQRCERRIGEKK
jgi:hypothetical protein